MIAHAEGEIIISTAEDLQKIGTDAAYPLSGDYVLSAEIDNVAKQCAESEVIEGILALSGLSLGLADGDALSAISGDFTASNRSNSAESREHDYHW